MHLAAPRLPALIIGSGAGRSLVWAHPWGVRAGWYGSSRVRGEGDYYWWNVGGWGNRDDAIERSVDGAKISVGAHVPRHVETGRWHDLRIELDGPHIRCYLDGEKRLDVENTPPTLAAAIAGQMDRSGEIILKVVNGTDQPLPTAVRLEGAGALQSKAEATVLTADRDDAENTLADPNRVAPVSTPVSIVVSGFRSLVGRGDSDRAGNENVPRG